jgi:uncharacterized ferredoxin-like protein
MTLESDAVETVARLMALSARTAPKAKGVDMIVTEIIAGERAATLAGAMRAYGEERNLGFFVRDAKNVEASDACILIGSRLRNTVGLDCGGCGFSTCSEMLQRQEEVLPMETPFQGPNCIVRMADLGIAVGSAVRTAAMHNVDNRVMYTVGVAALSLGWLPGCGVAYGIPLKASGKNIFYDRTH